MAPRRLPLAEALRVRSPCRVGYDNMTGEGAKRFCASCNKEVHDVAALTRREADELIRRSRGTLCFHIHVRRSDGAILLADGHATPKPLGGAPAKKLVATVAAVTALAACAPKPASMRETTPQTSFEVSFQPAAAASPSPSTGSEPPKASEPAKATSPSPAKPPAKHYVVIDGQGPWSD